MTLLAALFERLDSTPLTVGQPQAHALLGKVEVGALAPSSEARQRPAAPAALSTPAPAAEGATEAASEPTRNAWTITRKGRPICCMVGAPSTRNEALVEARWRWPDADIQEN